MNVRISIREVSMAYEDFLYRTPIKFGGVALDRVTLLNVCMVVEDQSGKRSMGFGSTPLGNLWAWPSRILHYEQTLAAMKEFAGIVASGYTGADGEHPIDITHALEADLLKRELAQSLPEAMPALAKLVVASPFDAALHDAFGKRLGLNCYQTYGPEHLHHDLGHYLGPEFAGEHLHQYVLTKPKEHMPLYHLVGALDPLTAEEVKSRVGDGLPEQLGEWIVRDGLTHLKIKLNGDDLLWDIARTAGVNGVAEEVQSQRGVDRWWYSLDFNERCRNVGYLVEFLRCVKDKAPEAYDRIQYVEQPTARDLKAHQNNRMHEAAKLKPIVIDESLLDLESMNLARDLGYTGVAFKACKGQTQTLLLAAAAQKYGMFRCVQDLTCPGASLIQSAGIASHIPGVAAIEANSRQYCPAANAPWESRFPGIFTIRVGTMNTAILTGVGLGAV